VLHRRRSTDQEAPPAGGARLAALRLLGRRDFSAAEVTTRLLDRGHPADEVHAVVRDLVADRTLDDRRVAASHVRTASLVKHRGRLRIRRELEARGIDKVLIGEALAELPADDDAAAIRVFLARRRAPARPDPAMRRRLFQQLLRRGFDSVAIARALGRGDRDDEE
jgi:regulatory protein